MRSNIIGLIEIIHALLAGSNPGKGIRLPILSSYDNIII